MSFQRPSGAPISAATNEELKAFNANLLSTIDRIRRDGRLTPSTRMIGAEIFRLVNFRSGDAWPSVEHLAEKLCLTSRTVKRATAALKETGYLEVDKRGRCNRYRPVFEGVEKGTNCPLSIEEKGTESHLSEKGTAENRGQKHPEQGTKTPEERGQKRPPISLENLLGQSASPAEDAGAPEGAGATASSKLGPAGEALKNRLGGRVFAAWFNRALLVAEDGDTVSIAVPTPFVAKYIRDNFDQAVIDAFRLHSPNIRKLMLTVSSTATAKPAVPELAERRNRLSDDARWLVETGIRLVAEQMSISEHVADRIVTDWLKRCGRDAKGLRNILADAAAHELVGDDFANVVKQRTRSLLRSDQEQLRFGPEAVLKRSAS